MAYATPKFENRLPPPAPQPPPQRFKAGVTLTLTHQESAVLAALLSKISGHPVQSLRRYTDKIAGVLSEAGYPWYQGAVASASFAIGNKSLFLADDGTNIPDELVK